VAQALLILDIQCTGTTRENGVGMPQELAGLKKKNQALSTLSKIENSVSSSLYCKYNNAVLGTITAYCLLKWFDGGEKRTGEPSTNARIIRPVLVMPYASSYGYPRSSISVITI
jgi:hypothetical protein